MSLPSPKTRIRCCKGVTSAHLVPPRFRSTSSHRRARGANRKNSCLALRRRPSASSSSSLSSSAVNLVLSARYPRASTSVAMASPDGRPDLDVAEIVVVRHGETSWNAARILQGHLDVELNETGRQQANAVAQRLSNEQSFVAMYSSDLKRASETAKIISNSCNGLEVIHLPELRERNLGDIQGMTLKDAAKLKPKAYADLLSFDSSQKISGDGESLDQLHQRCTSALERIARKHKGERVIVVSHGGVIRELYKRACHCSTQRKIANASVNVLCISNDGRDWMIKTWGDVNHLNETLFLKDSFGGDRTSG